MDANGLYPTDPFVVPSTMSFSLQEQVRATAQRLAPGFTKATLVMFWHVSVMNLGVQAGSWDSDMPDQHMPKAHVINVPFWLL